MLSISALYKNFIKNKLIVFICLIISVFLLSSCNTSKSFKSELDKTDAISIIDENGQYTDKSGYVFDAYQKTENFEIYYNNAIKKNENHAREKLQDLEENYSKILDFFGLKKEDMPLVKIYMYGGDKENLYKAFESELGERYEYLTGKCINPNSIYTFNNTDLIYDFTECVFRNFIGNQDIPSWLLTGTVSYMSFSEDMYKNYYTNYSELDSLDFDKLNEENIMVYQYGYSLVSCIVEEYGEDTLKNLINSNGNIEKVLGINCDQLFEKWSSYVKNKSPDNVYGYDETNIIEIIDENGYYEDQCGYKFDTYLKSTHFEIYYNSKFYKSKERAENSINYLEENYDRILELFKVKETDMPIVKINMYSEYASFANIIREHNMPAEAGFLGLSSKCNKIYFSYHIDNSQYEALDSKTIVLHEFIHSVHKNKTNKKYIEKWLIEGLAMYYSQSYDFYGGRKPIDKGLPEQIRLNDYTDDYNTPYMYGYTMVECIIKEYGQEKLEDVIKEYGNIEKALGIKFGQFSEQWKAIVNDSNNN